MLRIHKKEDQSCGWYIMAVRQLKLQKKTIMEMYRELSLREDEIAQTIKAASDATAFPVSYITDVWSQILDACGIGALLSEEMKGNNTFERLITAPFSVLYILYREMEAGTAVQTEKLKIVGKQIAKTYADMMYYKTGYKMEKDEADKRYKADDNQEEENVSMSELILQHLNIKVCPYCGSNRIDIRENRRSAANMDHFFPKRKEKKEYLGIFAMSLYNLIPSCPSCNLIKGTKLLRLSPYDEECSDEDIMFEWKPKRIDLLLKKPQIALTEKETEILIRAREGLTDSSQIVGEANYLHGYGDDAITLGLASVPDADCRDSMSVPFYSRVASEELRFHYRNHNLKQMKTDFPKLNFSSAHLKASRYQGENYLQYQNGKLYHDLYVQIVKASRF